MVLRLVDYLKSANATALYLSVQDCNDKANLNISSLMDSWIVIRNVQRERDIERRLFIVKSRGMSHSADVRTLAIGGQGRAGRRAKGGAMKNVQPAFADEAEYWELRLYVAGQDRQVDPRYQ